MRRLALLPLIAVAAAANVAATPSPATIEGYWKNPIGSAIIAIDPCGATLCGRVVWASPRGKREVAGHTHQVVGMTVLTALSRDGDHWSGSLYIPDDNIHVSARLQPIAHGRMKLSGCALAGLICRTQIWTRTEQPLPPPTDLPGS